MKYEVNDLIIMRSPMHNTTSYIDFNKMIKDGNYIKQFLETNLDFKEAISISSMDLLKVVDEGRIGTKQQETIIKYFIRSIARSVPFGLFSSISCCKFGDKTNIQRKSKKEINKYCTVDFEWFYGVIKLLEKNKSILQNIKIKFNHQCYKCGDRLINPYTSSYGQVSVNPTEEEVVKSRIKHSKQIDFIINEASEWVTYKELFIKLCDFNQEVPADIIEKYINQLIYNEYLITELRVPLSNIDPLEQVLGKLKSLNLNEKGNKDYNKLCHINNLRKKYMQSKLGNGINNYLSLCNEMSKIYKVKNYLSVISQVEMNSNYIGNNIKKEINSFLDFMIAYSTEDNETPYVYEFKQKFIEFYGEYREVPILELLDGTMGLGNPYTTRPDINIESSKRKIIKKYIYDKIIFAIKNAETEIQLNTDDCSFLQNIERNKLNYSNSFELNVKILAKDSESIDNDKFKIVLAPCIGSNRCGKLVNRFYNLLDEDSQLQLKKIYKHTDKDEDIIITDTSYLPKNGRTNNICNGNINYNYSLDCGLDSINVANSINLSDIVVGYNANIDRLYIKSKKHNKIINSVSDNMLNRMVDNPFIRFIWEVSYSYEIHPIEQLMMVINYDFKYLPAISYGKVKIIPETWKIDNSDFSDLNSFEKFVNEFEEFKLKWKIPRFIYFLIHDRYMYVDTKESACLKYFYQEIKKLLKNNQTIIIQEAENQEELWISDSAGNKYYSEFVVQCSNAINNKLDINPISNFKICEFTKSNVKENLNKLLKLEKDRVYLAGGNEWLYFKIYLEPSKSNDFIIEQMSPLIYSLYKNSLITDFFFIRYADPDFHIRFRVRINEINQKNYILNIIINWLKINFEKQLFKNYVIDTYYRETERYGGDRAINNAENIFKFDTLIVMKILEIKNNIKEFDLDIVSFICMYSFIYNMFGDSNIEESFLENYINRKEFFNEFKEEKQKYVDAIENYDSLIHYNDLLSLFNDREYAIKNFINVINIIDNNGELMNTKGEIIMSLIHMFCNRLNGDRIWERKMLAYIRHALHVYNSKKKFAKHLT